MLLKVQHKLSFYYCYACLSHSEFSIVTLLCIDNHIVSCVRDVWHPVSKGCGSFSSNDHTHQDVLQRQIPRLCRVGQRNLLTGSATPRLLQRVWVRADEVDPPAGSGSSHANKELNTVFQWAITLLFHQPADSIDQYVCGGNVFNQP